MSKLFQQLLKATPVALGASLLAVSPGFAQETTTNTADILQEVNNYSQSNGNSQNGAMSQVTSVSQLRDVSPTDWAFEALRNLVERYGCIAGYPDRTFRGNQPLTRYEFAAGLNSCLQQIERLIGTGERGLPEEEMQQIQRLTQEFQAELAALGARVDNLEARVGVVEEQQFSTTTKLSGEAIINAGAVFGDEKPDGTALDDNITLSDRIRLNFNTSFTGKDLLRTRLQAGNFTSYGSAAGTDMARLGYEAGTTTSDANNNVILDELYYRLPIGDKGQVWVGAAGLDIDDIFNTHNPYFESSGTGAITRFNRYNPAVYRSGGAEGAGVGAQYKITDNIAITALYLTSSAVASNPADGNGLFGGAYTAGAQLDFNLGETLDIGLAYLHSYQPSSSVNLSGSTGSSLAKAPFDNIATTSDRLGLSGQWRATSKISVGAFGGYINANAKQSGGAFNAQDGDSADVFTWGANVAILDLGGEGNILALAGGMAPKLTSSDTGVENNGTGYIVEAEYRWQVTDNIQVTPGAYVVIEPDDVEGASEIWGAVLRTTFKF